MNQINDILAKHFSGLTLSSDEQIAMDQWRLENQKEFDALKKAMATNLGNKYHNFDNEKGWQKMAKKIDASTQTFSLKPILKFSIAASIAVIIGLVGFQLLNPSSPTMIVFENKTNTIDSLSLPDGSKLFLAPNTKLEYAKNFGEHRNISLQGEAFFDVFPDKNHPFVISTDYGEVEVLGTSFNVNTFESKTKVDVKTGLVSLSTDNSEIKLTVDESAWADGNTISQKTVSNPNTMSWKTGRFQFDNTPMGDVVKFLESFFGDVIDIENNDENCSFTGSFNNQNIDGIIEALVLSCNLEFSKENDRFILK